MKILVTGGAGFIGSHVAQRYVDMGHRVIIIDNLVTGNMQNIPPEAEFIEMDIRDREVSEVFSSEKPDIVNHHAAQMDVRKSVEDPEYDAQVNVLGTLNVFQNAVQYGTKKIIFASTGGAIYGEQDYFPADERHPLKPLSPYGITKLTAEKYLYYYLQVLGLSFTVLRYANVYGPRQNPHGEAGVVAIFTQKMLEGEQPVINGSGRQTRDYVFVEDVVKANEMVLNQTESRIYNISTGKETNVNVIFKKIKKLTNSTVKEVHGPEKSGEQLRSVLASGKIKKELGWTAQTSLDKGLKLTIDYFQKKKSY